MARRDVPDEGRRCAATDDIERRALRPAALARMPLAVSPAAAASMSAQTTAAPAPARTSAVVRPMPLPAPVTRATRPVRSNASRTLWVVSTCAPYALPAAPASGRSAPGSIRRRGSPPQRDSNSPQGRRTVDRDVGYAPRGPTRGSARMGARWASSTSTRRTVSRQPWRNSALPPSASRLRTSSPTVPAWRRGSARLAAGDHDGNETGLPLLRRGPASVAHPRRAITPRRRTRAPTAGSATGEAVRPPALVQPAQIVP